MDWDSAGAGGAAVDYLVVAPSQITVEPAI
jgi:hypothetical protein